MLLRRERAITAVAIVLDIAFHGQRAGTVSAAGIAERLGLARRGIEPLMQALSRAGVLESVRGPHGGYRLGRARRDLRLGAIVEAAMADEPAEPEIAGRLFAAVVAPLWADLEAGCRRGLEALTVEDLLRRATAAGLKRPAAEPLNFAI